MHFFCGYGIINHNHPTGEKMTPVNKPQNNLKRIEYLLLSIQSNPGRSQRWHLRRLHVYVHGVEDFHRGGTNCAYFTSPSYRNVVWTDVAEKEVEYPAFAPVDREWPARKSKSAQMHLTRKGWNRANAVRRKLGLDAWEWGSQELPATGACKIYQTVV